MQHLVTNGSRALAVRAHVIRGDTVSRLEDRMVQLRDEGERGSQTAEYAMLGGIGVLACSGIAVLIKEGILDKLVELVFELVTNTLKKWFL